MGLSVRSDHKNKIKHLPVTVFEVSAKNQEVYSYFF
jgi:hypothetical protein